MIPRATPVAAPVIRPRMVTLVMEGLLPTNTKPATAIHKVQRTMRMFMGALLTAAGCLSRHWFCLPQNLASRGHDPYTQQAQPTNAMCIYTSIAFEVTFQSGKNRITGLFG